MTSPTLYGTITLSGYTTVNSSYYIDSARVPTDDNNLVNKKYVDAFKNNPTFTGTSTFNYTTHTGVATFNNTSTFNGNVTVADSNYINNARVPTADANLTNKKYVDLRAPKDSPTFTGTINLSGSAVNINSNVEVKNTYYVNSARVPTDDANLTNKKYVDGRSFNPSFSGTTNFNGNVYVADSYFINNVRVPTADANLTNKKYVDDNKAPKVDPTFGGTATFNGSNMNINSVLTISQNATVADSKYINNARVPTADANLTNKLYVDTQIANNTTPSESGTWTPVLTGSNTAGTFNYDSQSGTYYTVGNLVYASCRIFIKSENITTPPEGNISISGLPYAQSDPDAMSEQVLANYAVGYGSVDILEAVLSGSQVSIDGIGESVIFPVEFTSPISLRFDMVYRK
jgi:hypothetical protein